MILASTAALGQASRARRDEPTPEIKEDGYTSARVCGSCHEDIYRTWKDSLHAFSIVDPIFDTAYMQAIRAEGEKAKQLCLQCHAPLTMVTHDYNMDDGITREGVTCDFCHTVTAVHLDRTESRFSTQVGLVKRSVLKHAESPAHEVAYSELHGKAEFCGACHNYTPNGVPIMTTFDEWLKGPYSREGVPCQGCHMTLGAGSVVRGDIKSSSGAGGIHLHELIHDSDQLRSALAVQILDATRTASGVRVMVQVENVGSGHMVPTGIPTREIVLTVVASQGDREQSRERRYRKIVADARNRPLDRDADVFLYAAKVLNDTRIAPREKRLERFSFEFPRSGGIKVSAELTYTYSPMILDQKRIDVKLGEAERQVY